MHTVAARLGVSGAAAGELPEAASRWVDPLVKDLQAARGRSLVIAGDGQPAVVHALAHAMNTALGNVGSTVAYTPTAEAQPIDQRAALRELVGEMNAGTVEFLLILGANPVYSAPADLKFGDAMQKVGVRAHLGLYEDETAALCHWHIPEAHFLEAWSDVRSDDGTVTIVQPLIAPLYNGKSAHEVLAAIGPDGERSGYDLVREHWMREGLVPAAPRQRHDRLPPVPSRAARRPGPRNNPGRAPRRPRRPGASCGRTAARCSGRRSGGNRPWRAAAPPAAPAARPRSRRHRADAVSTPHGGDGCTTG